MQRRAVRFLIMVLCISIFLVQNVSADASTDTGIISVRLDKQTVKFDVNPVLKDNRVLVPISTIFKALGFDMEWDSQTETARAKNKDNVIVLKNNYGIAKVNGDIVQLDAAPQILNGRILVPLRFVAEATGAKVEWEPYTRTVIITSSSQKEDEAQEQIKVDSLASEFGKTKDELLELKKNLGDWDDVVLSLAVSEKQKDTETATAIANDLGSKEETVINMKNKLGNWTDVTANLIFEKQYAKGPKGSFNAVEISNFWVMCRAARLDVFCDKDVYELYRETMKKMEGVEKVSWQTVVGDLKIDIIKAAGYFGMTKEEVQDLRNKDFADINIYEIAQLMWRYDLSSDQVLADLDRYEQKYNIDPLTQLRLTEQLSNVYASTMKGKLTSCVYDWDSEQVADKYDQILMKEFDISKDDVSKYNEMGFNDIFDIARLKKWKVTDEADIKMMKSLDKKYNAGLDKINDLRLNNFFWKDVIAELSK